MSITEQVPQAFKFVHFFLNGKKMDLPQYCFEQAQAVDPTKTLNAIEDQHLFIKGTKTFHTLILDFPYGEACLYYIDHFITLAKITIKIPLKLYMKEVDQQEVLKG